MNPLSPAAAASAPSSMKDVTAQNFMQEVLQASLTVPVLVYFTAAWCGPCKQFGPLLEKVVNESKGAVKLARVDIDKSPQIAQQFRIQSVPMVFVFSQGQPLDAFAGVIPESQIRQLIAQLAGAGGPSPEQEDLKAALEAAKQMLAEGHIPEALQYFEAILGQEPQNVEAIAGLANAYLALKDTEKAEAALARVPKEQANNEAIASVKAALALAKAATKADNTDALRAKVKANPADLAARYELAGALFVAGQQEEAIGELLAVIAKDKNWNEGAARTQLLTFFEALGRTDPLAVAGRRKLSSILFA